LTVRRLRGMMNSLGLALPEIRRRHPYNAAYLHPDDLAAMDLADGAEIDVVSDVGRMPAIVEADATVRPGVLSISHCWGGLPDERLPYEAVGASTNLLVRTDRFVEAINAMPRLSSIPVRIEPRCKRDTDLAEISLII
jgi:anaerobic selenocysteine-containing dehydrogenase